MKPNRNSNHKKSSTRLFPFSDNEERMMVAAMKSSIRFMDSYGKGRQPYTIDYSHYENDPATIPTEQSSQS